MGFKKTHLLVDPGLSLGHLPRGLARLELRQLSITGSLGLKPTSHIKGLELEFCRYFCPESLSSGPVMEMWMFLVIQFWVQLYKFHNGNFLTVCKSCTHPGSLGCRMAFYIFFTPLFFLLHSFLNSWTFLNLLLLSPLNQLLCNFYSFLCLTFLSSIFFLPLFPPFSFLIIQSTK